MENLVSDAARSRLTGYDFVFVGLQPFDGNIGSNNRDIALEIAKTNRVLYVNPPLDRITALRQRKAKPSVYNEQAAGQRPPFGLKKFDEQIWIFYPSVVLESINRLPDGPIFDWFNHFNGKKLAREILSAVEQLNFSKIILFNDSDMLRSFYLTKWLKPALFVYYSRDNLQAVTYWQQHGARLEPKLMERADVVAANSAYLAKLAAQHNPRAVDIGQGCDLTLFDPAVIHPEPEDLRQIAGSRIGYIGALSALRLDLDLLEALARSRPDWNVVLVGPEDDAFRSSSLHQLPNVHFLGGKPMPALAAYMQHMDVLINPQKLNPVTIGNYPRKIDEYLAMGKPTVAIRTEAMAMFSQHVYLATTSDEFVALTARAIEQGGPASANECIRFARSHTWAASVGKLTEALGQVLDMNQNTVTA